jgi:putative redox protein
MNQENPKADVQYAGADFYIATSPSGHAITLETDGKRNSAPTPIELLLMALGACTGSDVVSIMRKKRERVTNYKVEVHGRRRKDEPRGFEHIEVKHILRGYNISEQSLRQAIELSQAKYCSVAATLRPAAEIVSTYQISEEMTENLSHAE